MSLINKLRKHLLVFVLVFVVSSISAAAYIFAHGGDTSLIHGCVGTGILNQGRLRIVDANGTCNSNETPLDWNIQGPAGATNTAFRDGEVTFVSADGVPIVESVAICLVNEKVTGGGYSKYGYTPGEVEAGAQNYQIIQSKAITGLGTGEDQEGWVVKAQSIGEEGYFQAHAVCAAS